MNFSEEVVRGLEALISDSCFVEFNDFKNFVEICFEILLKNKTEANLQASFKKIDLFLLKKSYAALIGVILEVSKSDAEPLLLQGLLGEYGFTTEQADYVAYIFEQRKKEIRNLLSTTGFIFPHITDVDWRLDYYIKSNKLARVDKPVYYITLKTEASDGQKKNIDFTCSLEDLQDLVYKLRDATKQVENHYQTMS